MTSCYQALTETAYAMRLVRPYTGKTHIAFRLVEDGGIPCDQTARSARRPDSVISNNARWSLVLAAGHRSGTLARDALATLCQAYWYPMYAFIRRKGHAPDEAQDLTQTYFARLLEEGVIPAADQRKGRWLFEAMRS